MGDSKLEVMKATVLNYVLDVRTLSPGHRPFLDLLVKRYMEHTEGALQWYTTVLNYCWIPQFAKRTMDGRLANNAEESEIRKSTAEEYEMGYILGQHIQRSAIFVNALCLWGLPAESEGGDLFINVLSLLNERINPTEDTPNTNNGNTIKVYSSLLAGPLHFGPLLYMITKNLDQVSVVILLYSLMYHNESFFVFLKNRTDPENFLLPILNLLFKLTPSDTQSLDMFRKVGRSSVNKGEGQGSLASLHTAVPTDSMPSKETAASTSASAENLYSSKTSSSSSSSGVSKDDDRPFPRKNSHGNVFTSQKSKGGKPPLNLVAHPPTSISLGAIILLHLFTDDDYQWRILTGKKAKAGLNMPGTGPDADKQDQEGPATPTSADANKQGDAPDRDKISKDSFATSKGHREVVIQNKGLNGNRIDPQSSHEARAFLEKIGIDYKKVGISGPTNLQSILIYICLKLLQWNFSTFRDNFLQEGVLGWLGNMKAIDLDFWVCQQVLQLLFKAEKSLSKEGSEEFATPIFRGLLKLILNSLRQGGPFMHDTGEEIEMPKGEKNWLLIRYHNNCGPMAYSILREAHRLRDICTRHPSTLGNAVLATLDYLGTEIAMEVTKAGYEELEDLEEEQLLNQCQRIMMDWDMRFLSRAWYLDTQFVYEEDPRFRFFFVKALWADLCQTHPNNLCWAV